jgi:hypothetical protein
MITTRVVEHLKCVQVFVGGQPLLVICKQAVCDTPPPPHLNKGTNGPKVSSRKHRLETHKAHITAAQQHTTHQHTHFQIVLSQIPC